MISLPYGVLLSLLEQDNVSGHHQRVYYAHHSNNGQPICCQNRTCSPQARQQIPMIVSTSSETGDGISYPWLLTGRIITFNYEVESGGCFINSDASFLGTEKKISSSLQHKTLLK